MSYEHFASIIDSHLRNDDTFYDDLLSKIYSQPERYVGIFRATSAQTKLLENIACSREIRFGDAIETIVTEYLAVLGYKNLPKNIGNDVYGRSNEYLLVDQLFEGDDGTLYLVEQKMRDDHDSSKKRGQYTNFQRKYQTLSGKYPKRKIHAIMWFVDPTLHKNANYYLEQAKEAENNNNSGSSEKIETHICYGSEFFELLGEPQAWCEFESHLETYQRAQSRTRLKVPNFDRGVGERKALKRLKETHPRRYEKLAHDEKYATVRRALFPTGHNFVLIG